MMELNDTLTFERINLGSQVFFTMVIHTESRDVKINAYAAPKIYLIVCTCTKTSYT